MLIHHPPVSRGRAAQAADRRRAISATCIAAHGAELVLHGHDHRAHAQLARRARTARACRRSACRRPRPRRAPADDAAAYNLYAIDGAPGAWRCEMISRGIGAGRRRSTKCSGAASCLARDAAALSSASATSAGDADDHADSMNVRERRAAARGAARARPSSARSPAPNGASSAKRALALDQPARDVTRDRLRPSRRSRRIPPAPRGRSGCPARNGTAACRGPSRHAR